MFLDKEDHVVRSEAMLEKEVLLVKWVLVDQLDPEVTLENEVNVAAEVQKVQLVSKVFEDSVVTQEFLHRWDLLAKKERQVCLAVMVNRVDEVTTDRREDEEFQAIMVREDQEVKLVVMVLLVTQDTTVLKVSEVYRVRRVSPVKLVLMENVGQKVIQGKFHMESMAKWDQEANVVKLVNKVNQVGLVFHSLVDLETLVFVVSVGQKVLAENLVKTLPRIFMAMLAIEDSRGLKAFQEKPDLLVSQEEMVRMELMAKEVIKDPVANAENEVPEVNPVKTELMVKTELLANPEPVD